MSTTKGVLLRLDERGGGVSSGSIGGHIEVQTCILAWLEYSMSMHTELASLMAAFSELAFSEVVLDLVIIPCQ